jgi:hypothetical protein
MSSFLVPFKSTRLTARLATSAAGQKILARLASSTSHSFHSRIPIPVRSQHVVPSLSTVAIPAQSSTPSQFVRTKPASSLPKKTADSIQKHVERVSFALMRFGVPVQLRSSSLTQIATVQLRKTRAATTTYKTAPASKPAVLPPARPRPVPVPVYRPVPSPCIVTTLSALSLSASQPPTHDQPDRVSTSVSAP